KGSVTRNGQKPEKGGIFEFKSDRPTRWAKATDVWITGLFENGYADNTVKVKSFDLEKKILTTVHPHMYGFTSGHSWNRWTALNLLEEIDMPGEYAIDRAAGKVYFLPPNGKNPGECRIEVSRLSTPLIAIEGATGLVLDGITLENARGMGVYMERGANNRIQNCTLRNLGMLAVSIGKGISADPDYRHGFTGTPVSRELGSWHEHIYDNPTFDREAGTGHGIINCSIYNIGAGAISLSGGDRMTLKPAGNFVENCDIHHFNRWDRTYKGGVNIEGVGNRIAHCKIHEGPALAIYLHGNDHVIEYNEITRVMLEGDDMGAFYMGRDPTERGNIIRYNYWHHLANHGNTCALYFDDSGGDGSKIYGNVFQRAGAGLGTIFITGGSDFYVEQNLFIDCKRPIYPQGFRGGSFALFKKRMELVGWNRPPWSERYPEFAGYLEAKRPRNNRLGNNLVVKQDDPRFIDGAA
ncbi:MAG TPA: right-handed parallel beta-helix repeat-containing protein, partial [Luteolibacter sp.]